MAFTDSKSNKPVRLRVTMTVEAGSQKDLEEALTRAASLGRARPMLMSFGSKKKGGPTISVRTTRVRGTI